MRISPFVYSYSFKSNDRAVVKDGRQVYATENSKIDEFSVERKLYSNYTTFFRNDIFKNSAFKNSEQDWFEFAKIVSNEFKNAPKVNVYDIGCSDGSEPYSLILAFQKVLGRESEKFFPIKAYDFDSEMIKIAQSGKIPCDILDKTILEKVGGDFIIQKNTDDEYYTQLFSPADSLKKKVVFECGELSKVIPTIESENSLVITRNIWIHLDRFSIPDVLQKMANQLKPSSLMVVSPADDNVLYARGVLFSNFERIAPCIYRKKDKVNNLGYKRLR